MEEDVEVKCAICGELSEDGIFLSDWTDCAGYSWLDEELEYAYVCYGCIESLHEYGNRMVYYDEHGKISVTFDERIYFYDAEDYEEHEGYGDVMRFLEEVMKSYVWEKTDAWRGHYEAKDGEVGGWVKAVEGWNDAFSDSKYTLFVKEVMEYFRPILVVFPRSSNLCVVYYDVWCRKEDKAKVQRLIVPEGEAFNFGEGIYCKAL